MTANETTSERRPVLLSCSSDRRKTVKSLHLIRRVLLWKWSWAALAVFGWPLWIFRDHEDLTRTELAVDYFTHGAAFTAFICLVFLDLLISKIEGDIAKYEAMAGGESRS